MKHRTWTYKVFTLVALVSMVSGSVQPALAALAIPHQAAETLLTTADSASGSEMPLEASPSLLITEASSFSPQSQAAPPARLAGACQETTPSAGPTLSATGSPTSTIYLPVVTGGGSGSESITITPEEGGVLTSSDGRVRVEVPAGAVDSNTTISYQPLPDRDVPGYQTIGPFFELTAQDAQGNPVSQFKRDLNFTISYDEMPELDEDDLALYYSQDNVHWQPIPSKVDTTTNQVFAQLDHFTYFAIIVPLSCDPDIGEGAPEGVPGRMLDAWLQDDYGCPTAEAYIVTTINSVDYWAQDFPNGAPAGTIGDNPNIPQAFFVPTDVWNQYEPMASYLGGPLGNQPGAPSHFIDPGHNFRDQEIWYFEYGFVSQNVNAGSAWEAHQYFPQFPEGELAWELDPTPDSDEYRLVLTTDFHPNPPADDVTNPVPNTATAAVHLVIEDPDGNIESIARTVSGETSGLMIESGYNYYPTQILKIYVAGARNGSDDLTGYSPCDHYDPDENARIYYPSSLPYSLPFVYGCVGNGIIDTTPPTISNIVLWHNGLGLAVIQADVTDNVGVAWVRVTLNGVEYDMPLWQGDTYGVIVPVKQGLNTFFIEAADFAGNQARAPESGEFEVWITMYGLFGMPRWMGFSFDPVNSRIGNYVYSYKDIEIPALGPDVVIERWYNAQSRYDGPFGIGWTFVYDMRLTEVDNLLFSGAQLRYADGHTVNFDSDGAGGFTTPNAHYDTLQKEGDEYVLTMKDQTVYRFNADGRLIAIADKDDNQITFNYAGEDLTEITDASGRVITLSYTDGRITSIAIPDYGTLQYDYLDGHLVSVTDTEGSQAQYEYNADGYITKITSPKGNPFLNEQTYDDQGRVIFQRSVTGFITEFTYDDDNNTTIMLDAYGNPTTHIYDDDYRLIEEIDALGYSTTYTYNDDNEKLTVTDKNGHTTTYTYDDNGNMLTVTDPLGNVTTYTYDDKNNVLSKTDALGNVFTYEYDDEGHLIRLTDPLGGVIEHTYNDKGLLIRTVDPLGNTTETTYNDQGLPVVITDALGNVSTMTYDSAGQLLSHTDAEGNTATYQYNSLGLPISITDPEGYVTTYEYDADHNLVRETNADGYHKTYTYDDNGRLVAETDWAGNITTYVYDDLGRKVSEMDPLGHTISYTYDAAGNLVSMTDKRGATTTYTYDPNGNLLTKTDALGYITTYRYDALNRRIETEGPCACGSRVERVEYDALGRIVKKIDALGNETQFEYDALGREIRRIDALGNETRKEHDLAGNLIAETDALGNVTRYEYDALNQQVQMINRLGDAVTKEYDKAGRLVTTTNERGYTTRYVYDGNNRLLEEIDALGNVTTYTYDGRGNRLTTTDALGRVTTYTYDANGNQISVTNPRGYTTTYAYDALNRKVKMTDALGGVTTYTYDPAGAMLTETDPLGCTRQFMYDLLGRRIAETDRNGNTTTFEYDPAGNLVRTTDPLGGVTTHTFDANNNKLTETNALGHTTTYQYDALNRQVQVVDALGGVSTRVYDALGRVVEETDANGHTTRYTYDAEGRRTSTIDALGHVTTYEYDATGNQTKVVDRNGHVTLYTYDALNRRVALTNALGYTETTAYDAVGNRIEQVNFRGYATRFEYDANDNLVREIDALGGETTYEYDALDRQVAVTDANGHTTSYTYDAVGNLLTITLPEGQVSSYSYECERNRLTFTNAKGYTTVYVYDALNRRISETDPLGHVTRTEYDAIGQKIRIIDAEGNETSFAYDALGRLISVTDALGYTTLYTYDPVGNRLTETDANGYTTTFTYDALNRLVAETNPLGHTWTYTYDPEGNLIQQVDAKGQVIIYEFDAVDQLVAIHYLDSSQDVSFEYDPNGNMTRMVDAVGTTMLSYDPLDQEIRKADPYGRVTENTYDPVGNRLSLTYPSGDVVTYRYNANDWLVEMRDPDGGVTAYTYDPDGLPIRTDFPNGTWTDQVYDEAGRLVQQFNGTTYNDDVITSYDYTLDAVGNRLQTIERYTSGQVRTITKTYQYNVRYELLQAVEEYKGPPAYVVTTSYTYDPVGNRLSMTTDRDIGPGPQSPPETILYTYDAANRMLSAGDVTYTYDANGNRLTKLTPGVPPAQSRLEAYEYDAENRLTLYTRTRVQSGQVEQRVYNVYDGLGRRLNKGAQESSGTVKWVQYALDSLGYDQLVEFPQTGPPRITQLYRGQGNQLVSMDEIQGGGLGSQYWFATDGLGSVAATTKQQGQSAHEYFYDPYGQIIDENGHWEDSSSWTDPHNHYLLTGKEWDEESRLYYFGARFYDAETGVWLTQDPYRSDVDIPTTCHSYLHLGKNRLVENDNVNDPMSLHRYLYVRNSPINRIDPLGFFDWITGHVEEGDTLSQIAKDAQVSIDQIRHWNPKIKHPDKIYVGWYLWLSPKAINAGIAADAERTGDKGKSKWGKSSPKPPSDWEVMEYTINPTLEGRVNTMCEILRGMDIRCDPDLKVRSRKDAHKWSTAYSIYAGLIKKEDLEKLENSKGEIGKDEDGNIWYQPGWGENDIKENAKKKAVKSPGGNVIYAQEGYESYDTRHTPNLKEMPVSNHIYGKAIDVTIDWNKLVAIWNWNRSCSDIGANVMVNTLGLSRPFCGKSNLPKCASEEYWQEEPWHFELKPRATAGLGAD